MHEPSSNEEDVWRALGAELRAGKAVFDSDFDVVYARWVRAISSYFWTPVSIARRVAELLALQKSSRVLDVGSGVGKFCIVGAAATGAKFTGVEHREPFVRIAREAAARLNIDEVDFIQGGFETIDVREFDAIYLFNPFEENLWPASDRLGGAALSRDRFWSDVATAERWLAAARRGTRVATYHGFGGDMPPGYNLKIRERRGSGHIELWTKVR